jgi:hypothetical protein
MTTALEKGEGTASNPGRYLSPGKTQYPLYRRLGGPQGRSGQVRKISPSPGFDTRTVQPVATCYNDYATRPKSVRMKPKYLYMRQINFSAHTVNYASVGVMLVSKEKDKERN